MWPLGVVVSEPVSAEVASMLDAREAVLVQELVADAPVEALRIRVLDGLAGADEVVFDSTGVAPGVESL